MKSAMGFLVDSYVVYCLKIDFPNQHYCVTFKKTKTKETWFTFDDSLKFVSPGVYSSLCGMSFDDFEDVSNDNYLQFYS